MTFQKICVLGLGYIGLPTSSTFAAHGLFVVGVDCNDEVVNGLQNGRLHISEPGMDTALQDSLQSGRLIIRSQPETADAFIIAVPTPFYEDKKADLRAVISASESIVPYLQKGNLVILESTSPPRTTVDVVAPILERSGLKAGRDFYLAYSPERVLPGQILRELVENARVIGGVDRASAEKGRELYAVFVRGEIVLTDATTAEMVKLMENTYRDINIAIANEFSRLADRFDVDIWEAIEIANLHPRVKILQPGPGVGGHCIGVDPWFLVEAAPDITPLIRTSREVNDAQPAFVVDQLARFMPQGLAGCRLAVLGLTYKANVNDFRESPALKIVRILQSKGVEVAGYDPYLPETGLAGIATYKSLPDAVRGADGIVLLVGHTEFRKLSPFDVAGWMRGRFVMDIAHILDRGAWQAAGLSVRVLSGGGR
ncbi:MAG: nucleotide sugar dehydrogenase [Anaerolineae bacterium]|nr:nucleotide sugar dehydrogenase [Anaerolineae bacterium]